MSARSPTELTEDDNAASVGENDQEGENVALEVPEHLPPAAKFALSDSLISDRPPWAF